MNLLLDTHILLWVAAGKLPKKVAELIASDVNTILFSTASIWEMVIKNGLGRPNFQLDVSELYNGLLNSGYTELTINSRQSIIVGTLPPIHKDPFDRILVAQALYEKATLVTYDDILAEYPCSVIHIKP
jgi:PIN domain nuclease of toxin-antitoxin system